MYNLFESDEVTSIMINYPALLLRKKSALYPEGRTSYRFKHALRRQVTVAGQSMFGPKKKKVKRPVAACEMDLPETDDRDDRGEPSVREDDDNDDDDNDNR